ncbi:MAG: hypothetical protein NW226_11035 [Microscillaceae bacterium]|nr:hypothetical protein [Microscillaceae bacterium]
MFDSIISFFKNRKLALVFLDWLVWAYQLGTVFFFAFINKNNWSLIPFWINLLPLAAVSFFNLYIKISVSRIGDKKSTENPSIQIGKYLPYETYTQRITQALYPDEKGISELSKEDLSERIRNASLQIMDFLKSIGRKRKNEIYRANLMLYYQYTEAIEVIQGFNEKLRFTDNKKTEVFEGFLWLTPELCCMTPENSPQYIEFVLPVPNMYSKTIYRDEEIVLALPGAPSAFFGNASIHSNTKYIKAECKDLSAELRSEIDRYFNEGEGKEIRSFASFPIKYKEKEYKCVGILNIDYNSKIIIKSKYISSSSKFIETLLTLVAPFVFRYKTLLYNEKKMN